MTTLMKALVTDAKKLCAFLKDDPRDFAQIIEEMSRGQVAEILSCICDGDFVRAGIKLSASMAETPTASDILAKIEQKEIERLAPLEGERDIDAAAHAADDRYTARNEQ